MASRATDRLSKDERREQLLDSAAALLLERGRAALTVEGVAARAGVSKALPYSHFDNAEDLVRALRHRELERIAMAVLAAVRLTEGFEAKVAATVHAYFEVIKERGAILAPLLAEVPIADDTVGREDIAYFARLFERSAGLSPPVARIASAVVVAGVPGAVDSWSRRVANRATIEAALVRLVVAGVEALAADEAAGRLPVPRP